MNETIISVNETNKVNEIDEIDEITPTLAPWDGALYAANTGHHRVYDARFLDTLPLRPTDAVLDLGCGSGDFTAIVAGCVPDGTVIGLDPQPSLLAEARRTARPNQRFVEGGVQMLGTLFPDDQQLDVVMTRAVLHWVPLSDHPLVLSDAHRLLRPGGWYRAEFGAAGNIPAVLRLLDDVSSALGGPTGPWTFADAGAYLELVEQAGFDLAPGFIRMTPQRRTFTRESLHGWFRSQVVQAYTTVMDDVVAQAFTSEVDARFDELARWDGSFDQTFVRMDVLAQRRG